MLIDALRIGLGAAGGDRPASPSARLAEAVALNLLVLSVAATGTPPDRMAAQRVQSLSAAMDRDGFWALIDPGLAAEIRPMVEAAKGAA